MERPLETHTREEASSYMASVPVGRYPRSAIRWYFTRRKEFSMKSLLLLVGVLLVLLGLHWIGQGTGYFIWPANPVMDDHIAWAYYGGATAIAGLVAIWFARRN
jgi:hypothetical protein